MMVRRIGDTRNLVGESPIWDQRCNCLFWVDIVGKVVHRLDVVASIADHWPVADFPTALALTDNPDRLMLTQGLAFGELDLDSGQFDPWFAFEQGRGAMRLNEGRCDPSGRFWTASMDNNLHADGSPRQMAGRRGRLYRVDERGISGPFVSDLGIPNTMVWSPDGATFYFGDTTRNILWAFDFDLENGGVANRRVFAEGGPGLPDGSTIDAEGFLWNARFGAGCLIRFAPDGRQDRVLELPATNPTACAFGSQDLATLYVTTGAFGLVEPGPCDGALLAVDAGVGGLPGSEYRAVGARRS